MHAPPPRDKLLADLLGLAGVVVATAALWSVTEVPAGLEGVQAPAWGGLLDLVLEGPDAGEWAVNAARVAAGQAREVDHHRMPTWLLLVGGLHRAGVDLVTAGHLVNRGLYALLGLLSWAAGRALVGPGTGLLAAVLVLGSPHLRLASERYGIDLAVATAVAGAAAAGLLAGRRPRWAPVAGLGLAAAALTHFTTLPLLAPAGLLAVAAAAPGTRLRSGLGLAAGLGVGLGLAAALLRLPSPGELVGAIHDGLPASGGGGAAGASLAAVLGAVLPGLGRGLSEGAARVFQAAQPAGLPWALVVVAGVLGLVGPGLSRWRERPALGRALAVGGALALLGGLAPLLAATGSPERYVQNLAPVGALLLARGLGGLAQALGGLLGTRGAAGIELVAGLALSAALVPRLALPSPAPSEQAVGMLLLTRQVQATSPADAPLACPAREVAVASGRPWCTWDLCSREAPGGDPRGCMARIRASCGPDQALLWVSLPGWRLWGPQNEELQALDAWVATQVPLTAEVRQGSFAAQVRVLPAVGR